MRTIGFRILYDAIISKISLHFPPALGLLPLAAGEVVFVNGFTVATEDECNPQRST